MTHPLPQNWQEILLDECAKRGSGHTPNKKYPEYWNGNIKWISLQDSSKLDKFYISKTAAQISEDGIKHSSAVIHPAGTVVLSRDAGVGKSAIMKSDMAVSQHFMAWHCGASLNNHFLYYWLQTRKPEFERIAVGSTIKTIGLPYFKKLKIILPPLPEQQRIVTILETWDKIIEKLERKIELKKKVKKGLMQQLLTGKKRLPGFSGEWEEVKLGDVCDLYNGFAFKSSTYKENGLYKIVTIANVQDGNMKIAGAKTIHELPVEIRNHHILSKEDILISMTGNVGRVCLVSEDDCLLNQRVGKLVPTTVDKSFLYLCLRDSRFLSTMIDAAQGGAQDNISVKDIKGYEFIIPTSKEEQSGIAEIITNANSEIGLLQSKLQKMKDQKTYLLNHLITGRIRTPETMSLPS